MELLYEIGFPISSRVVHSDPRPRHARDRHAQHPSLAAIAAAKSATASSEHPKSKLDLVTEGMKTAGETNGLFKMWYNDQRLLILIKSSDLDKEFIVLTTIAKGISRNDVIGGMYLGFDDDVIWVFKKVGDNLHVVRRNVRFLANAGTPEADAVSMAYSDSVLYSLPIVTDAEGGHVVDFTRAFMNDDQMIGRSIGFVPVPRSISSPTVRRGPRSRPSRIMPSCRVAAVYSGMQNLQTVIDPRGVQIQVHYGISRLPSTDYKPRKADDRVGYFLTVRKNFSDKEDDQHFVRYINRWNLKKESDGMRSRPRSSRSSSISKRRSPRSCGRMLPKVFSSGTRRLRSSDITTRSTSISRATTKAQRRYRSRRHQLQLFPLDHGGGRLRDGPLAA